MDVEDAKLAEFYYSKAYYSESERIFLKLKEKMPDNYDLHFRLGNIYVRTGQFQAAEDMYNRCIEIDPSEPKGWYNLSLLRVKQAIHLSEQGHRKSHFTDPDFAKQFVFLRDGLIKSITGK
ncbi:MAG: tetratricopeptide repeat protein [Cellvibrionales bacterium]|nr:tetratricopeptide repeat protein [Cellvibrionales bacterium]